MKYNIILIEGEYAGGCTQIGQQLARKLNIPYYRADILHIAAQRGHTSPEDLMRLEKTSSSSLLYSIYTKSKAENITGHYENMLQAEQKLIRRLTCNGPCIIVGLGGIKGLDKEISSFSAFIFSSSELYSDTLTTSSGFTWGRKKIQYKFDKNIVAKHKLLSRLKAKDLMEYQIILDSGRLGINNCTKAIISALEDQV